MLIHSPVLSFDQLGTGNEKQNIPTRQLTAFSHQMYLVLPSFCISPLLQVSVHRVLWAAAQYRDIHGISFPLNSLTSRVLPPPSQIAFAQPDSSTMELLEMRNLSSNGPKRPGSSSLSSR